MPEKRRESCLWPWPGVLRGRAAQNFWQHIATKLVFARIAVFLAHRANGACHTVDVADSDTPRSASLPIVTEMRDSLETLNPARCGVATA